jgi:predicted ribosomally synthesized peptide with SipW-like signal peptide
MTSTAKSRNPQSWKKIIATGGILAGAAALATMGAFAIFTDTDTATTQVDAGELDIVLTGDVTVSDIAPGDVIQRPVTISLPDASNDGDLVEFVRFYFDVTSDTPGGDGDAIATGAGASLVDGADGLTYSLITCVDGVWTTATTPTGPYACSTTTQVTGSGKLSTIEGVANAVDFTPEDFGLVATDTNTFPSDGATGGSVVLNSIIQFDLPTAAGNAYENAATELVFTGAAIQRGGIEQ